MKVLFDHQAFEILRWGGVSRYHLELLRGLRGRIDVELALARSRSEYVPELNLLLGLGVTDAGHPETFLGTSPFPGRKQLYSLRKRLFPGSLPARVNRELALARLRAGGFDLFHPTYYDPYFLEALGDRPFVVTVHDLAHDVLPELFGPKDRTASQRARLVRAAARVIAVSEYTKRDVVALLGVAPDRVDVVHHGFGWSTAAQDPGGLPPRFLLFVGTRYAYKNWAVLVSAIAPLLRSDPELHLVCTGHPFSADERASLERLGVVDKVRQLWVDEGTLRGLYRRALAFVFPSLHEGFGFPVLEAFSEGCPAVLSRATSLPEIGGDAASYFDPKDPTSIRDAVLRVVEDGALRAHLAERGRARVGAFTWEEACARTAASYRRALGDDVSAGAGRARS
jgi:glycosyltransferase involved in cell wall biosynthesis